MIARWHHENWDGTGYPDGLRREEIPLPARIVRLADVFDALRSERPYKPAWELSRCLEEIDRNAGRQFDPELVPIFLAIIESAPLGPWVARRVAVSEGHPEASTPVVASEGHPEASTPAVASGSSARA
jgi:HD-GYP domain-containing protein (c-di-GMP phosphodiesterase class II)